MSKVLLAFNGSLDSTLGIHWLKEHKDLEVVALVVSLGLEQELDDLAEQAILAGAASTHFEDLTDSFCRECGVYPFRVMTLSEAPTWSASPIRRGGPAS